MDFDNEFYKQWKKKATTNHRLFIDPTDFSKEKMDSEKIFSSTTIENQVESQAFSLRLSTESFIDETQESAESKTKEKQVKEVIIISDTSSDGSIFSMNNVGKSNQLIDRNRVRSERRIIKALESSDETPDNLDVQDAPVRASDKVNELLITLARQESKESRESKENKVIIEESDSEIEKDTLPQIIKHTVAESATLSERKKREILHWLSTNFEGSRCGSSCSQESVIADSRKSGLSSGNSSLERFEMNYETPNNRGRILKPLEVERSNRRNQNDLMKQSTIDQYFNKSKKGQSITFKDKTPGSKKSDNTPVNKVKMVSRRVIMPELENYDSRTPKSQKSDRTPTNNASTKSRRGLILESEFNDKTPNSQKSNNTPSSNVNTRSRRALIPELKSVDSKTPGSQKSNNTPSSNVTTRTRRALVPELKSTDSKTPSSQKSNNTPLSNLNIRSKRVVIPESESIDSKTPSSQKSNNTPSSNVNIRSKRVIIPESESIDSKTPSSQTSNILIPTNINTKPRKVITPSTKTLSSEKSNKSNVQIISNKIIIPDTQSIESSNADEQDALKKLNNLEPRRTVIIPDSLDITDDIESLNKSPDLNLMNKRNEQGGKAEHNITNDTTINECADILENLYGTTWRNKASALISATEPRKHTTKKLIEDVPTKKKLTFRTPRFDIDSESELSDKENNRIEQKKQSQTTSKKNRIRNRVKDNFINDDSTTESSPDCSYYTATSNPPQNNFSTGTTNTVKLNNNFKKILSICDSESEVENDRWKNKNNQRKLSFDFSSSSTSEFDPEDVIPPKPIAKNLKVKKAVNCEPVKSKITLHEEKQPIKPKSFLASLSKDVPLDQADFKAMTYRVKYSTLREELCNVLYKLFNEKVFDNQLPDDMPIEWSTRLRGTAGKCYNKQSLKALGKTVRSSRLVLATKVLDSPDRLRDTLIHEMCHAATWLVNNISDGHGCFWKAWANKAIKVFPELPPISRCHNYEIQTKYTYKCQTCSYSIGRHSKSLDLNRKRCGYCHGKFELLINRVSKDGKTQKKSNAQTKEPTGFALYVKENYHSVKQDRGGIKHGEIMKILGQQFSAVKLTTKPQDRPKDNKDESP